MTQEQLFQLFLVVLPFLLAVVVVPAARWLISKLPSEKQALATKLVHQAVTAVEQLAIKATSSLSSDQKKALAKELADTLLKSAGIKLSDDVVSTLIESAVFLLNQAGQASATASAVITPLPPIGSTSVKQ